MIIRCVDGQPHLEVSHEKDQIAQQYSAVLEPLMDTAQRASLVINAATTFAAHLLSTA